MEQFLETFFSWQHLKDSLPSVIEGFKTNLSLMFVAEACVLVWGMVLAPALALGRLHRPVPGHLRDRADLHDRLRHPHLGRPHPQHLVPVHSGPARLVVLPQAVRRVVPPLMNDFIGLQKDTAFIGIIGVLEGFRRAQIYAGQHFNLTSFTGLALCFIVLTFPMTRFTDRLLKRDQERLRVGGR